MASSRAAAPSATHGFLAANIEAPRERAVFVEKLRAHVLTNVYEARLKARKELLEEYEEQRAEQAHDGGEKKTKVRTVEPDDLRDPDVDRDLRAVPRAAVRRPPREARTAAVASAAAALELLVFVCNTAGAVLAIIVCGRHVARYLCRDHRRARRHLLVGDRVPQPAGAGDRRQRRAARGAQPARVVGRPVDGRPADARFTKTHVVSTLERCLLSTVAAEASAVIQGDTGDGADKNSGDGD